MQEELPQGWLCSVSIYCLFQGQKDLGPEFGNALISSHQTILILIHISMLWDLPECFTDIKHITVLYIPTLGADGHDDTHMPSQQMLIAFEVHKCISDKRDRGSESPCLKTPHIDAH